MTIDMLSGANALTEEVRDILFREARTAHSFSDEPVTVEQLNEIYELSKFGPTAANTQPLRITFLTTAEAKARLLPLMAEGNRAKTDTAPAVAILAADTNFHDQMTKTYPHKPEARDMFLDDAARAQAAQFNTAIQIGYFILATRTVGLAAGPMGGFDRAGVDAEFFADTPLRSQLVVNLGYPGKNPWLDRLPRLDFDEAVTIL